MELIKIQINKEEIEAMFYGTIIFTGISGMMRNNPVATCSIRNFSYILATFAYQMKMNQSIIEGIPKVTVQINSGDTINIEMSILEYFQLVHVLRTSAFAMKLQDELSEAKKIEDFAIRVEGLIEPYRAELTKILENNEEYLIDILESIHDKRYQENKGINTRFNL